MPPEGSLSLDLSQKAEKRWEGSFSFLHGIPLLEVTAVLLLTLLFKWVLFAYGA